MRKRVASLALVACAAAAPTFAPAQAEAPSPPADAPADVVRDMRPLIPPACGARYTSRGAFGRTARRAFKSPARLTRARGAKVRRFGACLRPGSKRWARRLLRGLRGWRHRNAGVLAARRYIAALPYQCHGGRWAVPCNIVGCESGGSWTAANRSGAIGPYQFLGKRIVWPVRTIHDRLAHHRLAAALWAGGGGAHHWAQCLS